MKYAQRSTECNDLRFQYPKFCLVRCFTLSVQIVQGTEWKKQLLDWNEYQGNTASIGFQFHSTKLNWESCLGLLMLNYIMSALQKMQLQLPDDDYPDGGGWCTRLIYPKTVKSLVKIKKQVKYVWKRRHFTEYWVEVPSARSQDQDNYSGESA